MPALDGSRPARMALAWFGLVGAGRPGPASGSGPGSRLAKSDLCIGIRSGAAAGDCWRVGGDDSSISAKTVARGFACLRSDHLSDSRISRRMGGGPFRADFLSNLEPPLPAPWTVEETDACFIVKDRAGMSLAYAYFEEEPGRRGGDETDDAR
jgi:hypothetical protein